MKEEEFNFLMAFGEDFSQLLLDNGVMESQAKMFRYWVKEFIKSAMTETLGDVIEKPQYRIDFEKNIEALGKAIKQNIQIGDREYTVKQAIDLFLLRYSEKFPIKEM